MRQDLFHKFFDNLIRAFSGHNFLWHAMAIILTYFLVSSGFDWWFFKSTRTDLFIWLGFTAAFVGFFVPVILSFGIYVLGKIQKSETLKRAGAAMGQAAILGWIISSTYKAFTGRIQPDLSIQFSYIDISRDFNFGFFEHGIFWGWPSSHTTIAFAMAFALISLFPRKKLVVIPAIIYAFYIGLGVALTIHWFSDFAAAAIVGTVIGLAVGNNYQNSWYSFKKRHA